jgi:hypothetical protein
MGTRRYGHGIWSGRRSDGTVQTDDGYVLQTWYAGSHSQTSIIGLRKERHVASERLAFEGKTTHKCGRQQGIYKKERLWECRRVLTSIIAP